MKQVIPFSKDIVFKTSIASITSISLEHEERISDGEISGDFIVFGDYKIHNDTTEKELFKYKLPFTTLIPDNVIPSSISIDVENFTYETIEDDVLKVNIDFSIEGDEREIEEIEEVVEEREENKKEVVENVIEKEVNETQIENELNFFLDNKILSNLANIEELREKDNLIAQEETNEEVVVEERKEEKKQEEPPKIIDYQEEKIDIKKEEIFKEGPIFRNQVKQDILEESDKSNRDVLDSSQKDIEKEVDDTLNKNEIKEEIKKDDRDKEEIETMISEQSTTNEYVTYHIHIVKTEETLDTIIKNYNSNLDILGLYNDVSNVKVGDKLIIPEYLDE